ncbi:Transcription factor [Alternaria alternata]|nr:Transcription factor [Alternaria alternata]
MRGAGTYGCRPAAGQRHCPAGGFAERPGLIRKSQARQIVPEAAASVGGVVMDTWCAATRSSIQVFEVGTSDAVARRWVDDGTRGSCSTRTCQDRKRKSVRLCLKGYDNKTRL